MIFDRVDPWCMHARQNRVKYSIRELRFGHNHVQNLLSVQNPCQNVALMKIHARLDCSSMLGSADNLNVMEVLASSDEAMPALAKRLAGASMSRSAPAVLSRTLPPNTLTSAPEQSAALELPQMAAPAAAPQNGEEHAMKQKDGPSGACEGLDNRQDLEGIAAGAAAPCSIRAEEGTVRQDSILKAAKTESLKARPSSAALSESPAALAMPAREEVPHAQA